MEAKEKGAIIIAPFFELYCIMLFHMTRTKAGELIEILKRALMMPALIFFWLVGHGTK